MSKPSSCGVKTEFKIILASSSFESFREAFNVFDRSAHLSWLYEVRVFHVNSIALYGRETRDPKIVCHFKRELNYARLSIMHFIILDRACLRYHKWSASLEFSILSGLCSCSRMVNFWLYLRQVAVIFPWSIQRLWQIGAFGLWKKLFFNIPI